MSAKLNPIGNPHFHILIAICGLILMAGLITAWRAPQLGTYDPANYVEGARNLLAGRGLTSEVVGNFYRRYQSVQHAEDRRGRWYWPAVWRCLAKANLQRPCPICC